MIGVIIKTLVRKPGYEVYFAKTLTSLKGRVYASTLSAFDLIRRASIQFKMGCT
jgi:hypothetical protein